MPEKQILRLKLNGAACRSAERLVVLKAEAVEGVQAAAFDSKRGELIAFVDPCRVGRDDLIAAAVASGLVPEEESEAKRLFVQTGNPEVGGHHVP